ncbi:MAG: 3-dehydroquinate synthase [Candidatus Omnitrophota bacterium]
MKKIMVRSSRGAYPVLIGRGLLRQAGRLIRALRGAPVGPGRKILIVTQRPVGRLYARPLAESLRRAGYRVFSCEVPNGEIAKSERHLFRLHRVLLSHGFERRDAMLALGGGVVGDLTAFCASTYLRGVPFLNVATTLLAQVDSAIGGKTGINLAEGKNLVGSFYPPVAVISDTAVLRSLPPREYRASLAEVVKYGVIRDAALFRFLEARKAAVLNRDPAVLEKIVACSASIKAGIVSRDEREETGERMILNYGHTFGHALEKITAYRGLSHGEAVSLGMIAAARLAVLSGIFPAVSEIRQKALLQGLGLPVARKTLVRKIDRVLRAMVHDKKKNYGRLRFVLPMRIGKTLIKTDIPLLQVRKALQAILSSC